MTKVCKDGWAFDRKVRLLNGRTCLSKDQRLVIQGGQGSCEAREERDGSLGCVKSGSRRAGEEGRPGPGPGNPKWSHQQGFCIIQAGRSIDGSGSKVYTKVAQCFTHIFVQNVTHEESVWGSGSKAWFPEFDSPGFHKALPHAEQS